MRSLLAFATVAALVVLPATAGAGGKPAFHDHGTFTETDANFCGTGESVDVAGRFNSVVWIGETGGDPEQELMVTFTFSAVITNPENGLAVVDSGAGSFKNVIVEGLESGPHTHVFTENGLRAKLKLANGPVLTYDAGKLVYSISFDAADNITDFQLITVNGPHDAFESDVWCEAATEALGIG